MTALTGKTILPPPPPAYTVTAVYNMRRRSGRKCIEMAKWFESARGGTESAREGTESAREGTESAREGIESAREGTESAREGTESALLSLR